MAPPPDQKLRLEDRLVRLIFVPILGVGIPQATGLYRAIETGSAAFWLSSAYFIFISFSIWHGNRYFHRKLRGQPDWITQPLRRIALLLGSSLLLTAPYSAGMLVLWHKLAGAPIDWTLIRSATILIVVCTMFIMHTYETVYLIRLRSSDKIAVAQLERAKAQAELAVLKAQIDPHFMFNSLNTLAGLIEEDPGRATDFTICLADVYRYILRSKEQELVTLSSELAFVRNYYSLLKLRFGSALALREDVSRADLESLQLPPVSLQLLLENAVKHNEFSPRQPLTVHICADGNRIAVWNGKSPLKLTKPTSKLGLQNLDERCRLVLGEPVEVVEDAQRFLVRVPARRVEPAEPVAPAATGGLIQRPSMAIPERD